MAQYFQDAKGAMHEFPDDATPEEIDLATRDIGRQKPESPQALYQRAQSGDADALAQYNARAQAAGQNTIEQDRAANNPTDGNANFVSGVGKSFMDTGRGIKQLFGGYTPEQIDEQRRIDAPLMDTGAGVGGNVLGAVSQMFTPAGPAKVASYLGKAAPYVGAAIQGGAFAGLQPVGSGESRAGNAGEGAAYGVGGQVIGAGAGKAANWLTPKIDAATDGLINRARSIGVNPDLGQISQNPLVKQITNQLGRLPFSGSGARGEANQTAVNLAVGKQYGVQGDKITKEAHALATNKLSKEFDRLKAQNSITVDPAFINQLKQTRASIASDAGEDVGKIADNWVNDLLSKSKNGKISGVEYQAWRERIGKFEKTGGSNGYGVGILKSSVDDAMDANIKPQDRDAWSKVQRGWANMKTVEPLVAKSTSGDIPPAQLMNMMTNSKAGKVRMAQNRGGEMGDIAEVGQRFLKEPADSGTAGRLIGMKLLGAAGLGGGAAWGAEQGYVTPGQLGWLATALMANRVGLKAASSKGVISGKTQDGLARLIQKTAPRGLPAIALTGAKPLTEEEKKKAKKP